MKIAYRPLFSSVLQKNDSQSYEHILIELDSIVDLLIMKGSDKMLFLLRIISEIRLEIGLIKMYRELSEQEKKAVQQLIEHYQSDTLEE